MTAAAYGSVEELRRHALCRGANGKRTYSFKVANEMCGDPHFAQRKTLEVSYSCGELSKSASAREHQSVYLDCTP